jgi:hypothetical protein
MRRSGANSRRMCFEISVKGPSTARPQNCVPMTGSLRLLAAGDRQTFNKIRLFASDA